MNCPHRIYSLPRRQPHIRGIPFKGSNGWGRSYTLMNQLSQPETAPPIISSRTVTRSSGSVPHTQWMGLGNSLGFERVVPGLVTGSYGYDSCMTSSSNSATRSRNTKSVESQRRSSWFPGMDPRSTNLASAKSTLCTAGIKYPGQWFDTDEARSTRRSTLRQGQPLFRHYLSQRRTQAGAPQH